MGLRMLVSRLFDVINTDTRNIFSSTHLEYFKKIISHYRRRLVNSGELLVIGQETYQQ